MKTNNKIIMIAFIGSVFLIMMADAEHVFAQSGVMPPDPYVHEKLREDKEYAEEFFLYGLLPFSIIFGTFVWYFFIYRWNKKRK
ncbi:hypothetical protein [Nitrosopumilus sp.]|uniref:hypothetical protein n=1 Tax=Nitrosopumilus sp. TaxID=2024843 RepID=UPI003B5B0AD0